MSGTERASWDHARRLFQSSEEVQEVLWNRRSRLVFPQLAERTTDPVDGGLQASRCSVEARRSKDNVMAAS